jgi:hypothetical protein
MSEIFFKTLSIVGITVLVILLLIVMTVMIVMPVVFVLLGLSLLREGNYLESQTFFLAGLAWFFTLTPIMRLALGENVMKMGLLAKLKELVSKK